MIEVLANIIGAATGGGLFGMLGGAVSQWQKSKSIAAARKHELELARLTTENERWAAAQNMAAATRTAEAGARQAALGWSPAVEGASQWVVNLRALFRPLLTLILLGASVGVVLVLVASARAGGGWAMAFNAESLLGELIRYGVLSLVFAANSAALFWYAERATAPPGTKHK